MALSARKHSEIRRPSRHYIADKSLNVTLNHNQPLTHTHKLKTTCPEIYTVATLPRRKTHLHVLPSILLRPSSCRSKPTQRILRDILCTLRLTFYLTFVVVCSQMDEEDLSRIECTQCRYRVRHINVLYNTLWEGRWIRLLHCWIIFK